MLAGGRADRIMKWVAIIVAAPLVIAMAVEAWKIVWVLWLEPPIPLSEITTPVDAAVAQDMCRKLGIPSTDRRCKDGTVVYAEDFAREISRAFEPGVSTYDDVQEVLGPYQYECGEPVHYADLGVTLFECHYDLRGDRVYRIGFSFRGDGMLYRVYASPRDRGG